MYLKDFVDIKMGQSPDSKFYNYDEIGLPFYQGKADFGRINPTPKIWCSKPKKEAKPNDILISVRAPVGDLNINNEQSCIGRGLAAITCRPDVDMMYVYYYLKYLKPQLKHISTGSTFESINRTQLENLIIDYKPYSEQIKISNILQVVEREIEVKENLLRLYDLLIKSRFDELFLNTHSIETMEIGELFEVGSSKRILQSELTTYGIPFYRVTDLINRINDRPVDIKQYVDELKYMTLIKEKYVPQAGDFLITARGTIGKIYEVKQNDKFYFQDGMITWLKRKNNYINNLFFMELVKTDWFRRQFYSSNNGTTISYLSITDTRHLKVLLPALNLQLQFAQEVYQINKLKSDVQKSIDETQLLMDSLMQEYFG